MARSFIDMRRGDGSGPVIAVSHISHLVVTTPEPSPIVSVFLVGRLEHLIFKDEEARFFLTAFEGCAALADGAARADR